MVSSERGDLMPGMHTRIRAPGDVGADRTQDLHKCAIKLSLDSALIGLPRIATEARTVIGEIESVSGHSDQQKDEADRDGGAGYLECALADQVELNIRDDTHGHEEPCKGANDEYGEEAWKQRYKDRGNQGNVGECSESKGGGDSPVSPEYPCGYRPRRDRGETRPHEAVQRGGCGGNDRRITSQQGRDGGEQRHESYGVPYGVVVKQKACEEGAIKAPGSNDLAEHETLTDGGWGW